MSKSFSMISVALKSKLLKERGERMNLSRIGNTRQIDVSYKETYAMKINNVELSIEEILNCALEKRLETKNIVIVDYKEDEERNKFIVNYVQIED